MALLGFLDLRAVFDLLLDQARALMPRNAFSMVEGIIGQIQGQASGGITSFGAILALWSTSSAVRMRMHALNVAYDVEDRPA